ncbi:MAG: hypothetical protein NVSMB20_17500 [Bradyrhizobium sp.]
MRDRAALAFTAALALGAQPASAQVSVAPNAGAYRTGPFPIPRDLRQKLSFAWSGPIEGATQALAAQLGYTAWATTASGLAIPRPAPSVNVSVGFAAASAADVVVALNRQAQSRAVVVLDPEKHEIGVVYFHA